MRDGVGRLGCGGVQTNADPALWAVPPPPVCVCVQGFMQSGLLVLTFLGIGLVIRDTVHLL